MLAGFLRSASRSRPICASKHVAHCFVLPNYGLPRTTIPKHIPNTPVRRSISSSAIRSSNKFMAQKVRTLLEGNASAPIKLLEDAPTSRKAREHGIPFSMFKTLGRFLYHRYRSCYTPLTIAQLLEYGSNCNPTVRRYEIQTDQFFRRLDEELIPHESVAELAADGYRLRLGVFSFALEALNHAWYADDEKWAINYVQQATTYLNVAVNLSSSEAAVELYRRGQEDIWFRTLQAKTGSPLQDHEARHLIRSAAKGKRECEWEVVAAYLDMDFNIRNRSQQLGRDIEGAINLLRRTQARLVEPTPLSSFFGQFGELFRTGGLKTEKTFFHLLARPAEGSPAQYMLDLVEQALDTNAKQITRGQQVKPFSSKRNDLLQLRDKAIEQLLEERDPEACFITAIRDCEFGDEDWVKYMQYAASRSGNPSVGLVGNPAACWLLTCYYCDGFESANHLDACHKTLTAAAWAKACIVSYTINEKPSYLLARTVGEEILARIVAMAAWSKLHHEQGIRFMTEMAAECEVYVKDMQLLSPKLSKKLDDYMLRSVPQWSAEECRYWIDQYMNPDEICTKVEDLPDVKWYLEEADNDAMSRALSR